MKYIPTNHSAFVACKIMSFLRRRNTNSYTLYILDGFRFNGNQPNAYEADLFTQCVENKKVRATESISSATSSGST